MTATTGTIPILLEWLNTNTSRVVMQHRILDLSVLANRYLTAKLACAKRQLVSTAFLTVTQTPTNVLAIVKKEFSMQNGRERESQLADGGGARSFSQLEIMAEIMHYLRWDKYPNDPEKVMLPCEHFDMIGGSDTGGLITIMLVKLRMSVEEASNEFFTIFEEVYREDNLSPSERTKRLRRCVEDMLLRRDLPVTLKLVEPRQEGHCAGFALATLRLNAGSKACLRTYPIRSQSSSAITVVEAALATCATQPAFTSVSSGAGYRKQEYIGAALGLSNPVRDVISEAQLLFGGDSTVAFLLSLGSGHPGSIFFPSEGDLVDLQRVMRDMINDCEQTAREIDEQIGRVGVYFRFSVEQGMQRGHPGLADEPTHILAQTQGYLNEGRTREKLNACVKNMMAIDGLITLDKLKHTGTDAHGAIFKGAPMLATHYIKRHAPRSLISEGINGANNGQQTIIVVTGMPGCGKTQLVTDLVQEFGPARNSQFEHTFFIDGSSEASIESDLIARMKHVLPENAQVDLKAVMHFFQNPQNSKWLIAFDNVDDVNIQLTTFLPQCAQGTILVTTRNQSLGLLASEPRLHVKLDVMSEEEAVEVVLRCAGKMPPSNEEMRAAALIAEILGHLPVALSQAGCYMLEAACSGDEYLTLLSESRLQLLDRPSRNRQRDCAYATLDISYGRLPTHLQDLIHLLAFFHFANFPMCMISNAAENSLRLDPFQFIIPDAKFEESISTLHRIFLPRGKWTSFSLQEIAIMLQSYSLASFTTTPFTKLIRTHPLTRDWAFDRLTNERRVLFQRAAVRLLIASMEEKSSQQYLLPHIEAIMARCSSEHLTMNDRAALGKMLRVQHQLKGAQGIWLKIYDSLCEEQGADSLHVATAALELAATYDEAGLKEMESLELEAIRIRTLLLGPRHIDTLKARGDLSWTWERQGRSTEARTLREEMLEQLREQLPPNDLVVLEAAEQLAIIHRRQYEFGEAETIQLEVLEERRAQLGDAHSATLMAMSNLAITYRSQNRYPEAEVLEVKVLEAHRKQLGDAHSETLTAMSNLGMTYYYLRRYSDAEDLQIKVLRERKAQLGDIHNTTLNAMSNLAATYRSLRRHAEAEDLQVKVLNARKAYLGDSHPDTLQTMHALATAFRRQGRYAEAELLQVKVLEARRVRLGDTHASTLNAMNDLAITYRNQHRYSEAETLQVEILEAHKSRLGDTHADTLVAMSRLAMTYYYLGRYFHAEMLQIKVLEERKAQLGDTHPDTIDAMYDLESTYHYKGHYIESQVT